MQRELWRRIDLGMSIWLGPIHSHGAHEAEETAYISCTSLSSASGCRLHEDGAKSCSDRQLSLEDQAL